MPMLRGLVVASMALVGAHAAATVSMTLLPSETHAQLAVGGDAAEWRIEPSHGSILQLIQAQCDLDAAFSVPVASLQIVWTPPNTTPSSTFDHLVGAYVPGAYATGVHVRARATDALELVEAESAVRSALAKISPTLNASLVNGFLARSPCLSAILEDTASDDFECFTASFTFQPFHGESVPKLKEALTMTKIENLRAIIVNIHSDSPRTPPSVDALLVSVQPDVISSDALSVSRETIRVATAVDAAKGILTVVELGDQTLTAQSLSFTPGRAISADVAISILGEGFHRRLHVAIRPSKDAPMCPTDANSSILLAVPLSASVYADLDELRRMERFEELRLFSSTKHIEIERPMAVSAQHTVLIEFPVSESRAVHTLELPIHLRYQSPSHELLYASADIVAPDIFVRCHGSVLASSSLKPSRQLPYPNDDIPIDFQRLVSMSPVSVASVPVPVGYILHGSFVSVITLLVTSLGSLLLVLVSTRSNTVAVKPQWKAKTS